MPDVLNYEPLTLRVKHERPPNYEQIIAAFPEVATMKHVLYAWHDTIYDPDGKGTKIHPSLVDHEGVHSRQQAGDPWGWWREYLSQVDFRLRQEIEAHRAEYQWWERHGNRTERRINLTAIAKRLCSPMYGRMISYDRAREFVSPRLWLPKGRKAAEMMGA